MNILFLSLGSYSSVNEKGLYPDLLREFIKKGDKVYILCPTDSKNNDIPIKEKNSCIYKVYTGCVTKNRNLIKKGINTLLIEYRFKNAIKRHFSNIKFDLVLYTTPPITLNGAVEYVKKRDNAKTYLMLKDIFPQNAVDLGMMSKTGIKAPLYKMFRKKEKKLYEISDHIGCMSPANIDFILKNNPDIPKEKVELCPNCIEPVDMTVTNSDRIALRDKYSIPQDKIVFVYGGNLGKPQGIPFLIDCLRSQKDNKEVFFLVVGSGTEYGKLEDFVKNEQQENVKLMAGLTKDEYDKMIASCDVGMIFLDHRFTIPNFPSRLLAYMQAKLPVVCATDPNTDIGKIAEDNGFGWWCESNSVNGFCSCVEKACNADRVDMGKKADLYLKENYTVTNQYKKIMESIENRS